MLLIERFYVLGETKLGVGGRMGGLGRKGLGGRSGRAFGSGALGGGGGWAEAGVSGRSSGVRMYAMGKKVGNPKCYLGGAGNGAVFIGRESQRLSGGGDGMHGEVEGEGFMASIAC
ncbi:hypothetical protein Tco_0960078 [Tanacetum coccineum]